MCASWTSRVESKGHVGAQLVLVNKDMKIATPQKVPPKKGGGPGVKSKATSRVVDKAMEFNDPFLSQWMKGKDDVPQKMCGCRRCASNMAVS